MDVSLDERLFKHKLTSIYSTKNLIIGKKDKDNFNKSIKEMTKNFSNIKTEFFNQNKISIIQVKNKKIKDTLFVNTDSINIFISELKNMKIPECILKQYSLTNLNSQKKISNNIKTKFRKIINPKTIKSKSNRNLYKALNNQEISEYIKEKEKIFKISKIRLNKKKSEKNILLLGKKRTLLDNEINNNNNKSNYICDKKNINSEENNKNIHHILSYKKLNENRTIYSTLKDVSRETLFFLIQKPDTTIEEITKYIFNMVNLKKVHGKVQTYNNIQRRVYDTINVLQGLNKIEKSEFLRIHYILSEKEKEELLIIQKQKELLLKLYFLYLLNLYTNNNNYFLNLKNLCEINFNDIIINKEQYSSSNDSIEFIKDKLLSTSKDISPECFEYLNDNSILEKFKFNIFDSNRMTKYNYEMEECDNQNNNFESNSNENNTEYINNNSNEIQIEYGNNFNSISTKFNTNDFSIKPLASPCVGAPALKYGYVNTVSPSPGEVKGLINKKMKLKCLIKKMKI